MQLRSSILSLGLLLCCVARAADLTGRVVGIADGDRLTILDGSRIQHKIRLNGIDASEKNQPYGTASKQHLSDLAYGKEARSACYKRDRYDREVCTVFVDGRDVGLAQLDAGLAWWYRKYAHEQLPRDRTEYESAEDRAAADRTGLWHDRDPVPPWAWRHERR